MVTVNVEVIDTDRIERIRAGGQRMFWSYPIWKVAF